MTTSRPLATLVGEWHIARFNIGRSIPRGGLFWEDGPTLLFVLVLVPFRR